MSLLHVVSISGGKDSAATAILALETQPRESLRFIFCDTGNEHESTYDYVRYMESHLGIQITTLRAEFSRQIANKREYILNKWPAKGVPQADCDRAAAAMVPTGNPFLDLCIWKGRFPSRRAQFCTEQLKTLPATEHQLDLIDSGQCDAVWSWQGIRMDESYSRQSRMHISGHMCRYFGEQGAGIYTYRPLLRWTAFDVFEAADCYGLKPNPLYLQGMTRVGCMPCINAGKDEILEISKRFPGHIDRVEMWEIAVAASSKRQEASFFPDPDRDAHLNKRGIRNVVQWSKTQRGGQLVDFIRVFDEPKACESAYGLCE
ncbi:phosphoadenosine phosphosulfate reductase family protein [Hydrogenophaga sp.]|uniref:phosphoadenosine phosphosulfate reductase family protein n=1 Tax=Hydrogenophaga sp. TaxID=1904254 RepID=UPI00271DDB41|nr:phosphoadenosine phosphosulfate reductase family protein [Hydrogenophaga sp.]MDO9131988.1 phosphoadenosine phosphosulfate reductase family protein [Hydrogenophaga sp.]